MQLELQQFLFEHTPTRRELLHYEPAERGKKYRVQVFRNHSFELIADILPAYLDYAGISVSFSYSGYDDSLSFLELDCSVDMVLLWIDATRYPSINVQDFLTERLICLRERFRGPVLLIPFGAEVSIGQPGVSVWDLGTLRETLGEQFMDERAKSCTGTALSGKAMMLLGKELGLKALPSLLEPPLKAVVVDFDNTLYSGVLGEEGADGLILTAGHRSLQAHLKRLAQKGLFLCAATKNDAGDVDAMLAARRDFPLKKEDFSIIAASWDSKAEMMEQILGYLNIGPESVVFLDDNIGELHTVSAAFPQIKLIHALDDASLTDEVVSWFPGLGLGGVSAEASLRRGDVQANQRRQELQQRMSAADYIRSLQMQMVFSGDNPAQMARISELANKTNQFIFNYKRYTPSETEAILRDSTYRVVTVSLSDRLSDSGMIGVCVGKNEGDHVTLEECFVSCRALGRGVDEMIVLGAIQRILEDFQKETLQVCFQDGPRNVPAQRFVYERLADYLEKPKRFSYQIPDGLVRWEYKKYGEDAFHGTAAD